MRSASDSGRALRSELSVDELHCDAAFFIEDIDSPGSPGAALNNAAIPINESS